MALGNEVSITYELDNQGARYIYDENSGKKYLELTILASDDTEPTYLAMGAFCFKYNENVFGLDARDRAIFIPNGLSQNTAAYKTTVHNWTDELKNDMCVVLEKIWDQNGNQRLRSNLTSQPTPMATIRMQIWACGNLDIEKKVNLELFENNYSSLLNEYSSNQNGPQNYTLDYDKRNFGDIDDHNACVPLVKTVS